MEQSENRLVQIFEELRDRGLVVSRTDFASLLDIHRTTLSSAMNGDPRAYTPNLIAKAESCRRRVLGEVPPPGPGGKVEELSPAEMLRIIGGQADTIRSQQEVIARLLGADTKKGAV